MRGNLPVLPAIRWLSGDVFAFHGTPASDLVCFLETTTPCLGASDASGARGPRTAAALSSIPAASGYRPTTTITRIRTGIVGRLEDEELAPAMPPVA